MTLDIAPGAPVLIDGLRYTAEDHSSFHDIDFRLDIVRLTGPSPAHECWLVAVLPEPYLMLLHPLGQEWLATPSTTFVHEGEIFRGYYAGSAHRVRRTHQGRTKDGRMDYQLLRSDSGRVLLVISRNDEAQAWVGGTLPIGAVELPERSA